MAIPDYFAGPFNTQQQPKGSGMNLELLRIGTFVSWPEEHSIRPLVLAEAGFYYTGENASDQVTCFSCKTSISNWAGTKDPLEEHKRVSPDCALLNQAGPHRHGNVPLAAPDESLTMHTALERITGVRAENGSRSDRRETGDEGIGQGSSGGAAQDTSVAAIPGVTDRANGSHTPRQFTPPRAATSARQQSGLNRLRGHDLDIQEIINRVPPTHKLSQPNPQPNSTDPRQRADFAFMDRMRSEAERRRSFYDWPEGAWQTPAVLAAAGFFYTGTVDRTQCAFCRGILRNWEPKDAPIEEHGRHFAECPFVNGRDVGNIPIQQGRPLNTTSNGPAQAEAATSTAAGPGDVCIMTQAPSHPNFAIEATRVSTYSHPEWPPAIRQSPESFAKAGFYYTGYSDHVKCFFCDGGLRNWEPQDEPWQEHARWFPRCPFVKMVKGDMFIQQVHQGQLAGQRPPGSNGMPTGRTYHIQAKEVKARMDTSMVQAVIGMGYPKASIRRVIEERLRSTGDDFPNATSLVEALLSTEEGLTVGNGHPRPGTHEPSFGNGETVGQTGQGQEGSNQGQHSPRSKNKRKRANKKKKTKETQKEMKESLEKSETGSDLKLDDITEGEYQTLLRQNEEMKEQRICKVCLDNEINLVFLPCAHLVCCSSCAPAMRNCPICRKLIRGTVRVFLT